MDSFLLSFLLTLCLMVTSTGSRILVLNIFTPKSHSNTFAPLIDELLGRNHEITYLTIQRPSKDIPGLKTVHMKDTEKYFNAMSPLLFSCTSVTFQGLKRLPEIYKNITRSILEDASFQEFWRAPGEFDVIVANALINEGYLGVFGELDAPLVLLSPNVLDTNDAWDLNVPNLLSVVPSMLGDLPCDMSFMERVKNTCLDVLWRTIRFFVVGFCDAEVRRHFPNAASSRDVVRNASVILLNSHNSYDCARAYMPYVIDVGAMHCRPAEKLPEDFEKFVNGSGDAGFIVFSMGSVVNPDNLPKEFLNAFIEAFSQIEQRVVWKFGKPIANLSSNVMLSSWIPQQDLMGHPKCKLAITHGGLLSMQEILYHGVPLLGVPLGADRDSNIHKAINKGFALMVDWKTVTAKELIEKITEMTVKEKYKQTAEKISILMKDRPFHPVETAAYWVEYVIRHKGAKHLRNRGAEVLSTFQYFLLDVMALVCLVTTIVLGLLFVSVKVIFKKCFRRGRSKKEKTN